MSVIRTYFNSFCKSIILFAKAIDFVLMKIPYFIYLSWYFYTFVIYYTNWYAKYREVIDLVDSVLYAIVIVHSLYFMSLRKYTDTMKLICIAMFLVLLLQVEYYHLNMSDESYIRLYKSILFSTLGAIVINTSLKISELK